MPALLATACAVRLTMGRPVLFRQVRPGRDGRPFELLKFRTMQIARNLRENETDDSRLTPLGRFLRATSLDELPELLNVLRGEMSIVGPRPLLMEYLPLYSREQMRRHAVLPGLTGWAQIHGRNALAWEDKFALDCWYVDNWSNELDIEIILRTFGLIARQEGISHGLNATMPKFTGRTGRGTVDA